MPTTTSKTENHVMEEYSRTTGREKKYLPYNKDFQMSDCQLAIKKQTKYCRN